MALPRSCLRALCKTEGIAERCQRQKAMRWLSTTSRRRTDGVFRELTDQRVQMPWVDAFRKQQKEGYDPAQTKGPPETPKDRDLTPKKMKDSYHSVVSSKLCHATTVSH